LASAPSPRRRASLLQFTPWRSANRVGYDAATSRRCVGFAARTRVPSIFIVDLPGIASFWMVMRYSIPIESLKAVINPLDGVMWNVDPIDPDEVWDAARKGEVSDRPWATMQAANLPLDMHRTYHVKRLAWLVNAPPNAEDAHKIILCVSADRTWFYDGNHRAAAAIVRGDPRIELNIASSGEVQLESIFPGIVLLSS